MNNFQPKDFDLNIVSVILLLIRVEKYGKRIKNCTSKHVFLNSGQLNLSVFEIESTHELSLNKVWLLF